MGLLGFDSEELAKLLDPGIQEGLTDPDDIPAQPDAATTQPGDLWILGDHRLLCGDSSKPEDLELLLGGTKIDLVNTDPPYNVKVDRHPNPAFRRRRTQIGVCRKRNQTARAKSIEIAQNRFILRRDWVQIVIQFKIGGGAATDASEKNDSDGPPSN